MRRMLNKNTTIIPKEWTSFQRNLIPSPRCKGCNKKCEILYDSHHDQYFSLNCGLVVMEQSIYSIPYSITYTQYNTTTKGKKNKSKKEK